MTTARKSKAPAPERPAPCERELLEISAAAKRQLARKRTVEIDYSNGPEGPFIASPHADPAGWSARLLDTFGTDSPDFATHGLTALSYSGRDRGNGPGKAKGPVNAGLAIVAAVAPENEAEGALAVQMAGVHSLACEMLGRARHSDCRDATMQYGNMAVKLARTYTAQMEALAKIRGGGKQQVEVRHVYVNGNAVIGDVHGGGGGALESASQPHAKALAHAPCVEMRGALEAEREALPRAEGEREG